MAQYGPTFCDITWGAGGSTSELTLEIADKMQNAVGAAYSGSTSIAVPIRPVPGVM